MNLHIYALDRAFNDLQILQIISFELVFLSDFDHTYKSTNLIIKNKDYTTQCTGYLVLVKIFNN